MPLPIVEKNSPTFDGPRLGASNAGEITDSHTGLMPSPSPSQTGLITEFQMVVNASPTGHRRTRRVERRFDHTVPRRRDRRLDPIQAGTTTFVHSQVTTDPTTPSAVLNTAKWTRTAPPHADDGLGSR